MIIEFIWSDKESEEHHGVKAECPVVPHVGASMKFSKGVMEDHDEELNLLICGIRYQFLSPVAGVCQMVAVASCQRIEKTQVKK